MKPDYRLNYFDVPLQLWLDEIPWVDATDARRECFMAPKPTSYTYGKGGGVRTYTSVPQHDKVAYIQDRLNDGGWAFNVCFLNRYEALDGTSRGPWKAEQLAGFGGMRFITGPETHKIVAILENPGSIDGDLFIAWCRDGVPRLLMLIEELQLEVETLRNK